MEAKEKDFPNRRKPWVAVFLSMIMPGLGQVYCGDIINGIVIILVITVFSSLWMVGIMHPNTPFLPFSAMMWGVVLLATVFAAIDAYRRARRTRYDYKRKDYNHWVIYLALVWIAGAGSIGYTAFIKKNICSAFSIVNNSMAPTILKGDRAIAGKRAYTRNDPERGDVVLCKYPKNRKYNYIKRIVALGGDTVEIKDGKLLINDQPLKTEWLEKKTIQQKDKKIEGDVFWETNGNVCYQVFISKDGKDFGPVTIPEYHCFVMGDNRNHSKDSRHFGTISIGAIKGKFRSIYWPLQRRANLDPQK
ncbi:MAG: signal peptidase I [Planctomycetes bacterium]|nr:signal peptidase I [Planctomycetota bacterium]